MDIKASWLKTAFPLKTATDTFQLGKDIGMICRGGEVIGLIGPLGAGKTVLVQGIAEGLGIAEYAVSSPTFSIMNLYPAGHTPLCHIDLYRLDQPLETIGLEEYLNWEGVTAIEWADKAVIDEMNVVIELSDAGGNERLVILSADSALFNQLAGVVPLKFSF
ncbi:MAG: tRNA (adenosine(37)-N6)-threonylcarbamoyltransferase complex ATPase subunit type 1 TsaE [Nitrospirota bacterium]